MCTPTFHRSRVCSGEGELLHSFCSIGRNRIIPMLPCGHALPRHDLSGREGSYRSSSSQKSRNPPARRNETRQCMQNRLPFLSAWACWTGSAGDSGTSPEAPYSSLGRLSRLTYVELGLHSFTAVSIRGKTRRNQGRKHEIMRHETPGFYKKGVLVLGSPSGEVIKRHAPHVPSYQRVRTACAPHTAPQHY